MKSAVQNVLLYITFCYFIIFIKYSYFHTNFEICVFYKYHSTYNILFFNVLHLKIVYLG